MNQDPTAERYEDFYRDFDSPLMRQIRREAYGEDIGQCSWINAGELRADIQRLRLSGSSSLVDLGCGPGGPLTFILAATGCRGTGVDFSAEALAAARARAATLGVSELLTSHVADLNERLALEAGSFDAAISVDAVLHLRNRLDLFHEVARVLRPGGYFLFTDAGVLTGCVSDDEVRKRSLHGFTQFVAPGWNEKLLDTAGLRVVETEDRTESALRGASGRLAARRTHREELVRRYGADDCDAQEAYLGTVIDLSRRRAVSRIMYLAQVR